MASDWEIVETEHYLVSLDLLTGDPSEIAVAISPIDYALKRNPTGFVPFPDSPGIYIAKTRFILNAGDIIPALRLWFFVDHANHKVHKQWIEICPVHEMLP
jgi:hypothetical protein